PIAMGGCSAWVAICVPGPSALSSVAPSTASSCLPALHATPSQDTSSSCRLSKPYSITVVLRPYQIVARERNRPHMAQPSRIGHPYHMHEAILAQPQAFSESIQRNGEALEQLAARLAAQAQLYLVGIGTSYHAALVGAQLLRAYAPETP